MKLTSHKTIETRTTRATRGGASGLTLLEMVAAMVLATMLFAALTSLLRCFADQERAIGRMSEAYPPTQQLEELLRRDVMNARLIRQDANGIALAGTMGQDWMTRRMTGRQAQVEYRIQQIDGESWLLRREVHLDETSSQRKHEEPIWHGATGIAFVTTRETSVDAAATPEQISGASMRPMPARLRLMVKRENGQPLIDLGIVHHWEDG